MGGDEAALHQIAALNEALTLAVSLLRGAVGAVRSKGRGSPFVHLLCEVGRCAECTAHAAGCLKARGTAITATVPEPRQLLSFGAS